MRKQNIAYRRLKRLAEIAAQESSGALKELIELAMYWEDDVGGIVDAHFSLPSLPSSWKKVSRWNRVWNKKAKEIVGF